MKFNSLLLPAIMLFTILTLNACRPALIPLSKQEQAFADSLKRQCNCNVTLTHTGPPMPVNNQPHIFNLLISNSPQYDYACSMDSATLIKTAKRVAAHLRNVVSDRQHPEVILINFAETSKNGRDWCYKQVVMDNKSGQPVFIDLSGGK